MKSKTLNIEMGLQYGEPTTGEVTMHSLCVYAYLGKGCETGHIVLFVDNFRCSQPHKRNINKHVKHNKHAYPG